VPCGARPGSDRNFSKPCTARWHGNGPTGQLPTLPLSPRCIPGTYVIRHSSGPPLKPEQKCFAPTPHPNPLSTYRPPYTLALYRNLTNGKVSRTV